MKTNHASHGWTAPVAARRPAATSTALPGRRASRPAPLAAALIAASLVAGSGCALSKGEDGSFFARFSGREAVESQLTGEALAQQKYSMRRLRRDLASFRITLEQLRRHGKDAGIDRFERFVRPYIETRVDTVVVTPDSQFHPELRPFRAELLLSKGVLMHELDDRRAVRQTIDRLERDFASMTSMLVLYPTGEAVTLEQGIALLRRQTGEI
ncbi:MAG: hypothetical protein R3F21_01650 [Myxococcota bacterium]